MRIAQVSDLHIRRRGDRHARRFDDSLAECIARVNAAAPDAVILTGDLVDTGHEEEYRRLRELVRALDAPYYLMPGNHDDPQALRRVFAGSAYLFENAGHLSYALELGDLRVLALDSMKRGRPGGYVDAERLDWLGERLRQNGGTPVLLALHHPPFAAGVWPMDWLGFANLRALEALVRAHPQIRRVSSGHVHCARAARWAGTLACTSPSTRSQHLLVGTGWQPPALRLEPGGFLMHTASGGEVESRVHRLDGTVESLH